MKNIIIQTINKIWVATLTMILLVACNDEFMDRFPETSISPEAFFRNIKDMELYTNTYYTSIEAEFVDYISDNNTTFGTNWWGDGSHHNLIRGNLIPDNAPGWSRDQWGTLRKYNLFLENAGKASGDKVSINHYIGFTRLQRAVWYYNMVKRYHDVPWYSGTLSDTNEDLLYKARDPRTLVVDSIMADLDFAVRNMSEAMGNRTRVSRWYAAAMMARICLNEGTFRKYHPELNLQGTANTYLNKAVEAAEIVMNSTNFNIDKTGGKDDAYRQLFANLNLANNREMILFKDFDNNLSIRHSAGYRGANIEHQPTRSAMESYQYITPDGRAVPFSTVAGYDKMSFVQVFENRDPRFSQTFMYPGYIRPGLTEPYRPNLYYGGYTQQKYMPPSDDQWGDDRQYTDLAVFRYAELLLIYAEAKAELGALTQGDLDKSINLIRDRVELPPTVIGQIVEDATLKAQFPDVTDFLILEVRRERRIELFCEQFRWDDLMRWKAGHLFTKMQEGIYVEQLGPIDINGDGVPTVAIFESAETNTVPEEERGSYSFFYLKNAAGEPGDISLTNGTSGFIVVNSEVNRTFKDPQYYYFPVPRQQTILNPNLKQTIYWDE